MNNRKPSWAAAWRSCAVGLFVVSQAALGAGAPPQIDQEWRDRVAIGYFDGSARNLAEAQRTAAAELANARSRGELRAELRSVAHYLLVGESDDFECKWLDAYLQRARAGGSSYRRELFDIAVLARYRSVGPCANSLTIAEVDSLAHDLGDSARMYFVLLARAAEAQQAGRYVDAYSYCSSALEYAITKAQRIEALYAAAETNLVSNRKQAANFTPLEAALEELAGTEYASARLNLQALLFRFAMAQNDFQKALKYMQGALPDLRRGVNGIEQTEFNMISFARALNRLGRPAEALDLLGESKNLHSKRMRNRIFRIRVTLESLAQLGTPEAHRQGLQEIKELREALTHADAITPRTRKSAESALSAFYEKYGNFEEALGALKRANQAEEETQKLASEKARLELQEKLNVAAKDKENAQLRADAELQAARQRGWIVAFGVAAVGVAAAGAALAAAVRRGRRLAQLSSELEQQNGELERRGERLAVISRELEARNAELEQRSASRVRLLAAACHDLRQPAHALGLMAELGSDAQQEPSRFVTWLQGVRRSTASLGEMLDELMDLGRLDGGHYTPQLAAVSLAELLQEVMLHFGGLAKRKGLKLDVSHTNAVVVSDRHLLRRIVFNLVSNAIKYTDSGFVRVSLQPDADALQLSVQDSGPGIPQDKLDDVFRDYVRLNPTKAAEGLGIGLSIVRRAAELLGHRLTLVSPPGQGTTVSLTMTLSERQPQADTGNLAGDAPHTARGLLVLLENDVDVREAMTALLRRWGHTVHAGPDAAAVLAPLRGGHLMPDLVITDLHLDGGDGLTEVAALRDALQAPALPALLVTGDLDAAIASQAAQARVYVAHKPLAPRKLAAMVEDLLNAHVIVPETTPQR